MTDNPALLKLDLAFAGARLGAGVRDHPDMAGWHAAADRGASALDLVLADDVWVSVPIVAHAAAFELRAAGDSFVVARGAAPPQEVRIVPPPRFAAQRTRSGVPMGRFARAYGGYLVIQPHGDPAVAVADVVETVRAAFAEGAVEFVYLHHPAAAGDDAGAVFLEPYVRAIKRHVDTLVAVQLAPPRDDAWIDRTYAMGVDALGYTGAPADPSPADSPASPPNGGTRMRAALAHAASIFPSGTVWSALRVDPDPATAWADIDALTAVGVVPVLSLLQPFAATAPPRPPQDVDALAPLLAHLFTTVRAARINMHWVRDLSFAVTPLEARFCVDEATRSGLGLGQFYRSRLGALAARNLARLRRRLRVRQVSDSYDSSGL